MARKTSKTTKGRKPPESKAPESKADETIVEAEAVDVTKETEAKAKAQPRKTKAAEVKETKPAAETVAKEPAAEDAPAEEREAESGEVQDAEAREPVPPVQGETTVVRKGGFVPMVLGGLVAGAIGFGTALYLLPQLPESWLPEGNDDTGALQERLEAQAGEIDALKAALADAGASEALEAQVAGVSDKLGALEADIAELKGALADLAALETRLSELEKAPLASASPAAVEAYQREMAKLQDALAAQRADVEAMAAEAEAKRASAEMTAQEALKRSAMSQILTSLETGTGFGEAVESLQATGTEVPDALASQSGGVPSVASLSESFPDAARAALSAARAESGDGGGIGGFLKTQLGARSLEPREGDDPDAVLSRMEAAAREGRLNDVMAEAEALPDAARAPLKDWLSAAAARKAALEAAEELRQQINSN